MNSYYIIFTVLPIIFASIAYVASNNIITTMIVGVISLLYMLLIAVPRLSKYQKLSSRFHSCYTFINSFIISLSVKGSLIGAFDYVRLSMDKDYLTLIDGISTLKEDEKIDYLKKYFKFDIYLLFTSIIDIFIEQGGDILKLSNYLITESRRSEDYLLSIESIVRRKLVDFIVMWLFTLIIIVILRFSLNDFYEKVSALLLFQGAIVTVFILLLTAIHLFIYRSTNVEIRGFTYAK